MRNLESFVSGIGVVPKLPIIENRNSEPQRIEKMTKNDIDFCIRLLLLT
ncbi:hypothetical protein B4073_1102 [Bacillus subtilis]|uniref:Uncharacterized protein n=1 Tax=Bacillus subtilis subsp. subtilis TaxID=135461 RepID=A0ABD3ZPV4_BACIU|nr:Hypothetical Protein U712_05665 [Bacillus subtilis PY79]AKE22951.1 hypothetical protein BsLM_1152 [Bacillus sp. LM 4-2]KIL30248.1 hypothetical protein B4067_1181 [Bacillus subtilis subsp. subtilis]KIN27715.1 hypothetical protein B4070_1225 [Bacillus subtilis]KIN28465.1 hypothetical protein B4068_1105 [Bacillus subtilis]